MHTPEQLVSCAFNLLTDIAVLKHKFAVKKRQKDCLWKLRTNYNLANGSLGFIVTHKQ